MKRLLVTPLLTCMLLVACDRLPEANAPRSASLARPTSILLASDNLDPNFNLEIILRPTGDGDGFGHALAQRPQATQLGRGDGDHQNDQDRADPTADD